jgi:hypothetical protein
MCGVDGYGWVEVGRKKRKKIPNGGDDVRTATLPSMTVNA